jgi:hypothetical protein
MRMRNWILNRPSVDIALTLFRRVKPYDRKNHPTTQPLPTYTWVVKRCGKHPSIDKYWTGRHLATAKTTDNCWSLLPHRARRFQSEGMAKYASTNSEACEGQALYYTTLE